MIDESVRTRLVTGSPLASGDRVFCDFADEDTAGGTPYTLIYSIGGPVLYAQDAPVSLRQLRIQISVYGKSGVEVTRDLGLIRGLLHYVKWSDADHSVQSCLLLEEYAVRREVNSELYHGQQDYRISYL